MILSLLYRLLHRREMSRQWLAERVRIECGQGIDGVCWTWPFRREE